MIYFIKNLETNNILIKQSDLFSYDDIALSLYPMKLELIGFMEGDDLLLNSIDYAFSKAKTVKDEYLSNYALDAYILYNTQPKNEWEDFISRILNRELKLQMGNNTNTCPDAIGFISIKVKKIRIFTSSLIQLKYNYRQFVIDKKLEHLTSLRFNGKAKRCYSINSKISDQILRYL